MKSIFALLKRPASKRMRKHIKTHSKFLCRLGDTLICIYYIIMYGYCVSHQSRFKFEIKLRVHVTTSGVARGGKLGPDPNKLNCALALVQFVFVLCCLQNKIMLLSTTFSCPSFEEKLQFDFFVPLLQDLNKRAPTLFNSWILFPLSLIQTPPFLKANQ